MNTPKPWKVSYDKKGHRRIYGADGKPIVVINKSQTTFQRTEQEQYYNDFLIAAAPELLDALERLISCDYLYSLLDQKNDAEMADQYKRAKEYAHAVIAKAKGEK